MPKCGLDYRLACNWAELDIIQPYADRQPCDMLGTAERMRRKSLSLRQYMDSETPFV
jgi:hypothetical protein